MALIEREILVLLSALARWKSPVKPWESQPDRPVIPSE